MMTPAEHERQEVKVVWRLDVVAKILPTSPLRAMLLLHHLYRLAYK